MKELFFLSLFSLTLFATPLQKVSSSFSLAQREELLQEFHKKHHFVSSSYILERGWNLLSAPDDGIDVAKTFSDASVVSIVATYEPSNKKWAVHSFEGLEKRRDLLKLLYIEPNVKFFVLAKREQKVTIISHTVMQKCKDLLLDDAYLFLRNSFLDKNATLSKDRTIALRSRYLTNQERGIYNDTRVMLIYPKIAVHSKRSYKYGPAQPKIALEFAKEYENRSFYIYDYKYQKCYKGTFPSIKVPPFPFLQKI